MIYSNEIKRKAAIFAMAIEAGDILIELQANAPYMSKENMVILYNFLADFDAEHKITEAFAKWLKQKSIQQLELF